MSVILLTYDLSFFCVYADDILVVLRGTTGQRLEEKASAVIGTILSWGNARGLAFNASKTQAMLIGASFLGHVPRVSVNGQQVEFGKQLKYLGIWLDCSWRWQTQVKSACDNARTRLVVSYRIAGNVWGLDFWLRKRLYRTIFLPALTYAAAAWHRSINWKYNTKRLNSVQRAALIWTCSAYRTISMEHALLLANEPPIEWIIKKSRALHMTKMRNPANLPAMRDKYKLLLADSLDSLQTNALIRSVGLQNESDRGELINYWTSQFLTGHGNFMGYLHRFKLADDFLCRFCVWRQKEEPIHLLFVCEQFDEERERLLEDSAIHDCHSGDRVLLNSQEVRNFSEFCKLFSKQNVNL